jgi:hypothetical protein
MLTYVKVNLIGHRAPTLAGGDQFRSPFPIHFSPACFSSTTWKNSSRFAWTQTILFLDLIYFNFGNLFKLSHQFYCHYMIDMVDPIKALHHPQFRLFRMSGVPNSRYLWDPIHIFINDRCLRLLSY